MDGERQKTMSRSLYDAEQLKDMLKARFKENMYRHSTLKWSYVEKQLEESPALLDTLHFMEETGGEPDVVILEDGVITFCDFSPETPDGRRSCCYDEEARRKRTKNPPQTSAVELAEAMGAQLLTKKDYRYLQSIDKLDQKTSSWVHTPETIRSLGGALFCDRRYDTVFTYHNGADSYYGARGFRCKLCLK